METQPLPKHPIFGPCLLWPKGWMDQDGTWHGSVPWSKPHCARWGPSSLTQKRDRAPPIFSPFLLSRNGWMHQDANWYGSRPRLRRLCVRWGPSFPSPKGAQSPQKGQSTPNFRPIFIVGWMHQDATWYGSRPQPRRLCVRWGPSFPSPKGAQSPQFWPMSVVAKRRDGLRWHLVWRQASAQATLCSVGTQLTPEQRHTHHHPVFGPCLLWPNGWMDEDANWCGSWPRPRPHRIRRGPSSA